MIVFSVDGVMREETRTATRKLADSLLKNGIGNTRKHVGMSKNVYPWTWCGPSACWCGDHGVASPNDK